ncbi:anoctamin-8 isoform X1 [Lutzomyia longipalpis]|uniref:anoctamin-8 isoform X1 n=2 Tax=Lutzomyia longipalpis TaxID=7200 RepID=UPI002483B366|nr:anoctamin-8 isoform X1 [Lutzomyia longipalpis]
MSGGRGEEHENLMGDADDGGCEEYVDDPAGPASGLRRRKGKIMSCAKETIENASRLIRRRVPCAGHLMTPRRLWLNKIPAQCDVVIEFPEDAPDEVLRWLLARIRSPTPNGLGLSAHVRAHDSTKRTAFYLSAPISILFRAAEEARLPKRLKSDLGGALRDFTTREKHCFAQAKVPSSGEGDDGGGTLFTSQERQWLVLQILQGLRAGIGDLEALQGKAAVAEGQSIIAAWQESGLITQVFPLHETTALTQLQSSWVRNIFAPQPLVTRNSSLLDDIAEYFGVKVALYFAWLGHYTCALGVPAVFGTLMWAGLYGRNQTAQDIGHVLFSLFNVAWASLYLEAWRRYSTELAFRWGTLSTPPELLEPPRPLYKGPLVESPVTGRLEPKEAPAWQRRAFRYLVSFPIIGLCLVLVFVVMFIMLRFQDWLDEHLPDADVWKCICMAPQDWWDGKLPEKGFLSCLSVIPKVLLAGAITLMDEAYFKLAVWLNDRENYRLQSKYENHLIAKVALFQFVNSFLSLFYIAFYLCDQDKLKEQLAGLLISRQIIGNLRESAWPYVVEQWKLAKLSFNLWGALSPTQETKTKPEDTTKPDEKSSEAGKRSIGQAEIESSLYKYDGTFSDHLEMLVQMGYVVLFSAAFPLAGLCALANNIMEIRSDAFKLAHVHQRPFGQRVANIGTWQNALSLLGLAAVIVNCALIGLSGQVSRLWPGLTSTQTVILIVALEHMMLGLRSALTWLLPELPSWLAAEIARAEHCRREMQCKGTSPRATPPSPSSTSISHPDQEENTPDPLLEQSSQEVEDIVFEPEDPNLLFRNGAPRSVTPDSPISQTSTVLIRPLLDSSTNTSGSSIQNIPSEMATGGPSACRHLKQSEISKLYEIPPYRGYSVRNSMPKKNTPAGASPTTKTASQPIQIPEIPPFRKPSTSSLSQTPPQRFSVSDVKSSPTKIPEIPPFKPRKSAEMTPPATATSTSGESPHVGVPDWARRLKVAETSPIHRSTDCIAAKELHPGTDSPEQVLKNAPSWSSVAVRTSVSSVGDVVASSSTVSSSPASGTVPKKLSGTATEEEVKAAELAAKKSRLKQSLVKRARSVAIFSLKLKERRAREAEKAAQAAVEHAKVVAQVTNPPIGGELSFMPIEQLIQVDDVVKHRNSQSGSGTV